MVEAAQRLCELFQYLEMQTNSKYMLQDHNEDYQKVIQEIEQLFNHPQTGIILFILLQNAAGLEFKEIAARELYFFLQNSFSNFSSEVLEQLQNWAITTIQTPTIDSFFRIQICDIATLIASQVEWVQLFEFGLTLFQNAIQLDPAVFFHLWNSLFSLLLSSNYFPLSTQPQFSTDSILFQLLQLSTETIKMKNVSALARTEALNIIRLLWSELPDPLKNGAQLNSINATIGATTIAAERLLCSPIANYLIPSSQTNARHFPKIDFSELFYGPGNGVLSAGDKPSQEVDALINLLIEFLSDPISTREGEEPLFSEAISQFVHMAAHCIGNDTFPLFQRLAAQRFVNCAASLLCEESPEEIPELIHSVILLTLAVCAEAREDFSHWQIAQPFFSRVALAFDSSNAESNEVLDLFMAFASSLSFSQKKKSKKVQNQAQNTDENENENAKENQMIVERQVAVFVLSCAIEGCSESISARLQTILPFLFSLLEDFGMESGGDEFLLIEVIDFLCSLATFCSSSLSRFLEEVFQFLLSRLSQCTIHVLQALTKILQKTDGSPSNLRDILSILSELIPISGGLQLECVISAIAAAFFVSKDNIDDIAEEICPIFIQLLQNESLHSSEEVSEITPQIKAMSILALSRIPCASPQVACNFLDQLVAFCGSSISDFLSFSESNDRSSSEQVEIETRKILIACASVFCLGECARYLPFAFEPYLQTILQALLVLLQINSSISAQGEAALALSKIIGIYRKNAEIVDAIVSPLFQYFCACWDINSPQILISGCRCLSFASFALPLLSASLAASLQTSHSNSPLANFSDNFSENASENASESASESASEKKTSEESNGIFAFFENVQELFRSLLIRDEKEVNIAILQMGTTLCHTYGPELPSELGEPILTSLLGLLSSECSNVSFLKTDSSNSIDPQLLFPIYDCLESVISSLSFSLSLQSFPCFFEFAQNIVDHTLGGLSSPSKLQRSLTIRLFAHLSCVLSTKQNISENISEDLSNMQSFQNQNLHLIGEAGVGTGALAEACAEIANERGTLSVGRRKVLAEALFLGLNCNTANNDQISFSLNFALESFRAREAILPSISLFCAAFMTLLRQNPGNAGNQEMISGLSEVLNGFNISDTNSPRECAVIGKFVVFVESQNHFQNSQISEIVHSKMPEIAAACFGGGDWILWILGEEVVSALAPCLLKMNQFEVLSLLGYHQEKCQNVIAHLEKYR